MMKSKKSLVITIIVLLAVMLGSFIGGGISLAMGVVEVIEDVDVPGKLEELGIGDGIESLMKYAQYVMGGEKITYRSDYVSESFSLQTDEDLSVYNTIVIEDVGFNVVVKGMPRTDMVLTFRGKYPSTVETDEIFTAVRDYENMELHIKGVDMPGHFNPEVGTVTIYMPSDYAGNIVFRNCMGEAEFSNINAKNLTVEYFAGEIDSEYINAENIKLYAVAGEVRLDGEFGSYKLDNCAGSFSFNSVKEPTGDSKIINTAGEISFTLPENSEVYIIDDCITAEVDCDIDESSSGAQFEIVNVLGEILFEED